MCGISGILSPKRNIEYFKTLINPMIASLEHRGPDSKGIFIDEKNGIALGHNRLSILDLSKNGSQPMKSSSGRYIMSFNGEIYNHLNIRSKIQSENWRGTSDTETLLAAIEKWGIDMTLELLNGMFVFALYDTVNSKLCICRDRAGEKPLYYGQISDDFVFASELKPFLLHPRFNRRISRNSLATFMQYGYIPAPNTIYRDINKLPAGCIMTIDVDNNINLRNYWALTINSYKNYKLYQSNDDLCIDELKALLLNSVEKQMISDVPIGVFLSGGIDSSLITAMMQSISDKPIDTFSIGFNEKEYDESIHARSIAKYLKTNHHELVVDAQMSLDVISDLPKIYSEPFADVSSIPTYLLSKMTRDNVTVSLSGDGADELFGGYERYYRGLSYWNKMSRIPLPIRRYLKNVLLSFPNNIYDRMNYSFFNSGNLGYKIHKLARGLDAMDSSIFTQKMVSIWENPRSVVLFGQPSETEYQVSSVNKFSDFESFAMYCDFKMYLPDDILVKVDRASMAVSLEVRAPFLDYQVIEYANELSTHYKIRDGISKWILKQILYQYVPSSYFARPKSGFTAPIDSWLRGPLKAWAWDLINPKRLNNEGYFNSVEINSKWNQFQKGKGNYQFQIWNVLIFQQWLEKQSNINIC